MGRAKIITRYLKTHDRELYCDRNKEGTLCIYRTCRRYDAYVIDGVKVFYARPTPHFVMALTDSWTTNGRPVDWGIEPIMRRIQQMDLWSDETEVDRLVDQYAKADKALERDLENKADDYARELQPGLAKATNDVITTNMKKIDNRRREDYGNRK